MNISRINISSQDKVSSKQPALDSHENSLRKQITNLQEKMKTISNDREMSDEQKTKEKQAAQEQLQSLNSELRRYQQQKRQEEAAKKQEEAKQAIGNANPKAEESDTGKETVDAGNTVKAGNSENAEDKKEPDKTVLGSQESGVLITLSSAKEQIADMGKIRTSLEGKQRTAATPEEKEALQKKIDNVSKGIGQKIVITEDTILTFRKSETPGAEREQGNKNASKQLAERMKLYADEKLDAINRSSVINNKKMFDNIAIITN